MAMAVARDHALREELRRAGSATLSLGSVNDSVFSLEEMGGDIGK